MKYEEKLAKNIQDMIYVIYQEMEIVKKENAEHLNFYYISRKRLNLGESSVEDNLGDDSWAEWILILAQLQLWLGFCLSPKVLVTWELQPSSALAWSCVLIATPALKSPEHNRPGLREKRTAFLCQHSAEA